MKHLKLILVFAVVAIGVASYFLFFQKTEQISYLTINATRGNISQEVNATGEVGAIKLVTIGAQVSGQIDTLNVKLGQHVKKGDLIAQINSTTQQNNYDIEKAKLTSYQAQLEAAKIQLTTSQSQYEREQKLYTQKATSKASLEEAESTFASAKSAVAELESQIIQTQIAVNTAEVNLGYTKIVSSLDGTVVSVPVEQGQTLNAATSTPTIVQIADLSNMEILMEISEGDITKVAEGMTVTYSVLSDPDTEFTTTLKSLDPALTTLTNGSYEQGSSTDAAIYYYGRLEVPNAQGKLHIGMTTQNVIKIAHAQNVLVIPATAVHKRDNSEYVNVLNENNQQVEKIITTGLSDSINIEISSGLSEGDKVILSNMSAQDISNSVGSSSKPRMM
ncbi:MacA family efflux pump subunit [Orbus sasakiae]|uniref:MacA family efflux pump subunit n=1 Tax=Orbus sasakiae TaxID=1078475 RepID=A0ABP9N3C1_9GAMM